MKLSDMEAGAISVNSQAFLIATDDAAILPVTISAVDVAGNVSARPTAGGNAFVLPTDRAYDTQANAKQALVDKYTALLAKAQAL
jgi:hypothetical protein